MTTKTPFGAWLDEEIAKKENYYDSFKFTDEVREKYMKGDVQLRALYGLRAFDETHPAEYVSCGCDDPACYKQDDYWRDCPICKVESPCPSRVDIMKAVGL